MSKKSLREVALQIHGMHCANCAVLIEREFKKIDGVAHVRADHVTGRAELRCYRKPPLADLQKALKEHGYTLSPRFPNKEKSIKPVPENTQQNYLEIGVIFLVIVAAYLILKQLNVLPTLAISDDMSYGFVFLIGLVAATSTCLAVTGGLLLAVAAKYNERFPDLSGVEKLKPNLYFNAGRLISYTVLGGAVGAIGSALTLSTRATGVVSIAASVVMIVLGFQLLKLFPWMRRFQPTLPKVLAHKIHDLSVKDSKFTPLLLGASTFFLPCGFTQALQLYVLSKGEATTGALTMLVFALGTLPTLMSLSLVSSFAKGNFQHYFVKFAGVLVILVGAFNFNNGMALTGINMASLLNPIGARSRLAQSAVPARVVNGKQIVDMQAVGLEYTPANFKVVQGVPVEWHIDGSQAVGCAQVLVVPSLGLAKYLSPSAPTVVTFVPKETGSIGFSCSMGMTTWGASFEVVPNTAGIVPAKVEETPSANVPECSSPSACANVQKVSLDVSEERGIYPQSVTVKKGAPVELTINDHVPLGGCMSVWVIPKYNVTIPMAVGTVRARFTPTETGVAQITCSMGSWMAEVDVTD
ncbi:sulfite exporter TauE/SafE family protein [Hyphomicrobium sp.]|uniref:urease accessory protein UreH domain-containing protein n=1 Tax=Hyphomicrobium sp. TaxID=82 RepID=UPI000F9540EE|nr:sulfite exporter TauE/SafE family protein [Hyphomicrobium sp.]RUO99834.1 MAG: hypothetical protein EKK30_05105 [Hyphomicrobium sp.]